MKSFKYLVAFICLTFGFASAQKTHTVNLSLDLPNCGNTSVTGVSISPQNTLLKVGEEMNITASVQPSNAVNKKVTWSSSDTSIAKVNSNGKVTGIMEGDVVITVTTEEWAFKANSNIKVEKASSTVAVTGITLTPNTLQILKGESSQLMASILPTDATNKSMSWSSDNASIVTVDTNGMVKGVLEGDAIVTVTSFDGSFTAKTSIKVISGVITGELFSSVSSTTGKVYEIERSIQIGSVFRTDRSHSFKSIPSILQNAELIKTPNDDKNQTGKDILTINTNKKAKIYIAYDSRASSIPDWMADWTATNVTIPTTDTDFKLYEKGYNKGNIILSGNKANGSVGAGSNYFVFGVGVIDTVVVPVTGLEVSPSSLTMEVGKSSQLNVSVFPSNASNKNVVWMSSDTGLVSIDQNGKATGLQPGNATIIVKTLDGNFEKRININITLVTALEKEFVKSSSNQVYPNPTSGLLVIKGKVNKQVVLSNQFGQNFYFTIDSNNTINIEELSKGIYYLYLEGGKVVKIVKN